MYNTVVRLSLPNLKYQSFLEKEAACFGIIGYTMEAQILAANRLNARLYMEINGVGGPLNKTIIITKLQKKIK